MKLSLLLVSIVVGLMLAGAACGGGEGGESVREVKVTLTEFQFDPSEVTVTAGETVRFEIVNEGEAEHDFFIEEFGGTEDEVDIDVEPGESKTLEYVVPDKPGTYTLISEEPGDEDRGMVGTFIIE